MIELAMMLVTAITSWVLAFMMGYKFYGIIIGGFCGQVFGFISYALYYYYGSEFEEYHKNVTIGKMYPNLVTMKTCEN